MTQQEISPHSARPTQALRHRSLVRAWCLSLGLLATASGACAAPDTLSNGSFESLDFSLGGYCYLQSNCGGGQVLDWTGNAVVIRSGNDAWGYPSNLAGWDVSFGDVLLGLQNNSDISQDISFATPGAYTLSWMEAGRPTFYDTEYSVVVGGNTLGTYSVTSGQGWTARSVNFNVVSAGSVAVTFDGHLVSPDGTVFLDKVSLVANPVPEPATAALLASGAALLAWRRKKAA